ncbi:DNA polymerase subunit delta-2 [Alternaria alternata]|nr:DNA polymerase subunit delta-2 [Alternaria alternata]
MQFSIISIVAALAATATATYVPTNGTATSGAYYPTGTGAASPTGARPTSTLPFTGGAANIGSSALGLIVAGGVAISGALRLLVQDGVNDARRDSRDLQLWNFTSTPVTSPTLRRYDSNGQIGRHLAQGRAFVRLLPAPQMQMLTVTVRMRRQHHLEMLRHTTHYMTLYYHRHWIADPPQRDTYVSSTGADEMMLEDESGRLRVTGEPLRQHFVTGCILAALGTEEADGTFMVIATQCADLPRQPPRWERDDVVLSKEKKKAAKRERAGKLAIVSGLELTGADDDEVSLDLLVEYLTGEAADPATQAESSKITRLVIAGGSLAKGSPILSREDFAAKKSAARHYGYDASSYNAAPTTRLDEFLCEILPSLPITMLPGASDPSNVALPQQPLHPALFPKTRLYAEPPIETNTTLNGFDAVTNPWLGDIDGYRVLGTGGQTVKDLLKYVNRVKSIDAMEMMLRWRCVAPTAPDTLWCYPFQDDDPLMLKECPHMYIAGCQKKFEKKVIEGPAGQKVLLISVPKFRTSGKIVLVDMESWDVEVVRLGVKGDKATKQRIVVSGEDMMEE